MSDDLRAEDRSPGAYGLYRCLVACGHGLPEPLHAKYGLSDVERAWHEALPAEAEVYGIDLRLVHALSWAHARYADMIGLGRGPFSIYRDKERQAYPAHFEAGVYSLDAAAAFMAKACDLPWDQCCIWVCWYRVKLANSGLLQTSSPPWWAVSGAGDAGSAGH